MTQLHPYLSFEKAKDAIEYYEDVFGATNVNRLAVGEEQAENFGLTKIKLMKQQCMLNLKY